MIRLPKATKTPVKSKLVPRQSLATIVKDLGKNTSCDHQSYLHHSKYQIATVALSVLLYDFFLKECCCVSAAISAPLKLKASRGPPTPINRNQASQPRVGQSLLGKRGFDSVSIPHKHTYTIHYVQRVGGFSFNKIWSLKLQYNTPTPTHRISCCQLHCQCLQSTSPQLVCNFPHSHCRPGHIIQTKGLKQATRRPSLSFFLICVFLHCDFKEPPSAVDAITQT